MTHLALRVPNCILEKIQHFTQLTHQINNALVVIVGNHIRQPLQWTSHWLPLQLSLCCHQPSTSLTALRPMLDHCQQGSLHHLQCLCHFFFLIFPFVVAAIQIWSVLFHSEFEEKNGIRCSKPIEGSSSGAARSGSGNGSRTNAAWSHCVSIDGKARNVKCKYCKKVLTSEVHQLKHHLAARCLSKYSSSHKC